MVENNTLTSSVGCPIIQGKQSIVNVSKTSPRHATKPPHHYPLQPEARLSDNTQLAGFGAASIGGLDPNEVVGACRHFELVFHNAEVDLGVCAAK